MTSAREHRAAAELRARMAGRRMDPGDFLAHFWQKRPLLVRAAFPAWRDPISRDELAGLSCESGVESRLVMERGEAKPWQVIPGPQQVARLRRLPRSHWTLLVQGVDRYIPAVADLLKPFRFIPDWRVDDVMISFAPRGGTVGPHLDSYDVFLLQGQGRRRWRIDSKASPEFQSGLDLRILKKFHTEQEWILEPGDMLYLPPNLAHYGVALEECLTYSIGFRSPSAMGLLAAAHERLLSSGVSDERYADPGLKMAALPGEIPRDAVQKLRHLLESALKRMDGSAFDDMIGELLTEPKGMDRPDPRPISVANVRARLSKGHVVVRTPGSRMGFIRQRNAIALFVDGRRYSLHSRAKPFAILLTTKRSLCAEDLAPYLQTQAYRRLVAELVSAGSFRLER